MNAEKLLRLASILDAAHAAGRHYDQTRFYYRRAPASAWSYWADAHPVRFRIVGGAPLLKHRSTGVSLCDAAQEFGISEDETCELFGHWGCGRAITAEDAAQYIRDFVERHRSG